MESWEIDPAPLRAITDAMNDGGELVRDLVDKYTETLPGIIDAIMAASHELDLNEVESIAHDLKSTSRLMGAMRLGTVAENIETAARSSRAIPMEGLPSSVEPTLSGLAALAEAIEASSEHGNQE